MTCPPFGVCFPVRVDDVHDGDTVTVSVIDSGTGQDGMFVFNIRLLDCWAPEINKAEQKVAGQASKRYLQKLIEGSRDIRVFIPFVSGENPLSKMTTFSRWLGHLFVGRDKNVSEMMVAAGHATKEKK